jgi:hypothetical protein
MGIHGILVDINGIWGDLMGEYNQRQLYGCGLKLVYTLNLWPSNSEIMTHMTHQWTFFFCP